MLLTTLFPTFLHGVVAVLTLLACCIQRVGWREAIAEGLESPDQGERRWAVMKTAWLIILTPLVAAGVVWVVLAGLFDLVGAWLGSVAGWLHRVALRGIDAADWLLPGVAAAGP